MGFFQFTNYDIFALQVEPEQIDYLGQSVVRIWHVNMNENNRILKDFGKDMDMCWNGCFYFSHIRDDVVACKPMST